MLSDNISKFVVEVLLEHELIRSCLIPKNVSPQLHRTILLVIREDLFAFQPVTDILNVRNRS